MSRYDEKKPFKKGDRVLVLEQEGGCDYTIGCGVAVHALDSNPDAVIEAMDDYGAADDDRGVVRATVFEVVTDVTPLLEDLKEARWQKEKEREREEKRKQIAKLQRELEEGR